MSAKQERAVVAQPENDIITKKWLFSFTAGYFPKAARSCLISCGSCRKKMREEREELCTRGMRVSEFRQNLTVSLYKTITTPPGHDFEAREPSQHGHALLC